MENRLDEFLNMFYETISFDSVDDFDSLKFESMFSQSAMLVERSGSVIGYETILEYINRFLYEMKNFPEYYSHGFSERQIGCERVIGEDFIFVKSEYEKTYFDGTQVTTAKGSNYMTLCEDGDWFKILFIAWAA